MLETICPDTNGLIRDRRRDGRFEVMRGRVWIDGKSYPLSNLSVRGFLATSYAGDHDKGEWVDTHLNFWLPDGEINVSGLARAAWVSRGEQLLGASFFRMSRDLFEIIGRRLNCRDAYQYPHTGQSGYGFVN